MIDVDHFKEVNDTYGHGVGDTVLQAITKASIQVLRNGVDLIGRYGDDEFVILLPETDSIMGQSIADRLRAYIKKTPSKRTDIPFQYRSAWVFRVYLIILSGWMIY
jgi:diguanylate cyclase (GGDEF)-like protein